MSDQRVYWDLLRVYWIVSTVYYHCGHVCVVTHRRRAWDSTACPERDFDIFRTPVWHQLKWVSKASANLLQSVCISCSTAQAHSFATLCVLTCTKKFPVAAKAQFPPGANSGAAVRWGAVRGRLAGGGMYVGTVHTHTHTHTHTLYRCTLYTHTHIYTYYTYVIRERAHIMR